MRPEESGGAQNRSARRHEHRDDRPRWPGTAKRRESPTTWNNKTMHHPATRIGEIKHGKT
jgi:hypothetical protein